VFRSSIARDWDHPHKICFTSEKVIELILT
jgi:hypothetical protein